MCGVALLVCALVGLAVTILLMYQQAPPGIEAEGEGRIQVSLGVVAVCAVSGLLGIVMSRVSWQHSSELLLSAQPVTPQSVQRSSGTWDSIWAGILAVIGIGMLGAFTERSFIDLSWGTVFLVNFGFATLAMAGRVRRLGHIHHVRYYYLAISLRSWRMVWIRQ